MTTLRIVCPDCRAYWRYSDEPYCGAGRDDGTYDDAMRRYRDHVCGPDAGDGIQD